MDQQNIDRLFREKLDQMEVAPSAKSWSQVEKQIRPKKTPIVYLVAASVSLLIISWIVWPDEPQQMLTPIASEVSYPVNQEVPEFELPVIKQQEKTRESRPIQKVHQEAKPQQQFAANETAPDKKPEIIKEAIPEVLEKIETQTAVAETEVPAVVEPVILDEVKEEITKPTFTAVKITYIASAKQETKEEVQKNDSTGVLKKFIAFTEKLDPGDMLADMKTAKDNLFNGGLKNKKERSSL